MPSTQLGRSVGGRYLTLRYRAAEGGAVARIGYAVPRKVGGAVDRNQVKRRLREAIARNESLLRPATDYVLIARPGLAAAADTQGFDWLAEQVAELLRAADREGRAVSTIMIWLLRGAARAADPVPVDGVADSAHVPVRADLLALCRAGDPPPRGRARDGAGAAAAGPLQSLVARRLRPGAGR